MRWLIALALGMVVFWAWVFVGSRDHCPSCGVELPDDHAYPGTKRRHCLHCGWRD